MTRLATEARLARLEAESAIRHVTARYFELCDTLGPATPLDTLRALFTTDAVWQGEGRYRTAFGRHEGADAIVRMLATYADPPHFSLNAHYLTAEAITIEDEDRGSGRWMMLQVSTYRDGTSDLRSARLALTFRRTPAGHWQIASFTTHHLFSRTVPPWSDASDISVPTHHDEERPHDE